MTTKLNFSKKALEALPTTGKRYYEVIAAKYAVIDHVLQKARFWEAVAGASPEPSSAHVLNRLLDGFEGKLTSSKWAKLAKCSQDTALRDIQELVAYGVLKRDAAGGRSTGYTILHN